MYSRNLLIVDDNPAVLTALSQLLEDEVDKVIGIKSPELIPGIMETQEIDLFIMDMNFSRGVTDGQEGMDWLNHILQSDPDAVVVMITAYGELELAIEAMKTGATDFISKPWDNEKLVATVRSGLMLRESRKKIRQLKSKQDHLSHCLESGQEKLYGKSSEMVQVMETIRKVAPSDSNVLVLGENGTGKELIARYIINQPGQVKYLSMWIWDRSARRFLKASCSAIPGAPLPMPERTSPGGLRLLPEVRFSWMKSGIFRGRCNPSCSTCFKTAKSTVLDPINPWQPISG